MAIIASFADISSSYYITWMQQPVKDKRDKNYWTVRVISLESQHRKTLNTFPPKLQKTPKGDLEKFI